jgi:signal-transduction protein with cAMP-binding, CBS, and nucleotidyltransferase domain
MERITSILHRKQRHFHTVAPGSSIYDALQQMHCENVDYLVVIDDEENFLGLLTDHDIASKVVFGNKPVTRMQVKEVMYTHLPLATTDDTVEKCMRTMRQHNIRFIPVFEGYTFQGIVSSEDIIHEIISNRRDVFDAEENEQYIMA